MQARAFLSILNSFSGQQCKIHIILGKSIGDLEKKRIFAPRIIIGDTTMATAIKAIPTLKGKEARDFLRRAEEAERDFKGNKNKDQHPLCLMAHEILSKAGML